MNNLAHSFELLDTLREQLILRNDPNLNLQHLGPRLLHDAADEDGMPGPSPGWEYITFMLWSAVFDRGGSPNERAQIVIHSNDKAWNYMQKASHEIRH